MAYVKNKRLFVSNGSGSYIPYYTVDNEIFLTSDIVNIFEYKELVNAILYPKSLKVLKVYLLNDNETIFKDISEYVRSGNLTFTYQQGVTRSGNMTLNNYNYMFNPDPLFGFIWQGRKIQIDVGLYYNNTVFWKKCGIFVLNQIDADESNGSVSFNISDKFCLLDGSVSGKRDSVLKISVGTPVIQAMQLCLADKNYNGKKFDSKPIRFPSQFSETVTPYTINQTQGNTSDTILEMAKMISCDTSYNDVGNLTIEPNSEIYDLNEAPLMWRFDEHNIIYTKPKYQYDYTNVPNRVVVYGAIENGKQFKATYENKNPKSKNNILISPPRVLYIEDSNIIGDELCYERAKYEWKIASRSNLKIDFKSKFIPFLMFNQVFAWNDKNYGFKDERFLINSVSFDLITEGAMNISASNVNEVSIL